MTSPVYGTVVDRQVLLDAHGNQIAQPPEQTVTMTIPAHQVAQVAALGGTIAPSNNNQQQGRQPTGESCRKGHKMVVLDYNSACAFISMHKTPTNVFGSQGRDGGAVTRRTLHCSHCLFQVEPQERVFLCEKCTMSKDQNSLPPVVFCETCVANRHHSQKNEWSSSCSSMLNGSCVDATLCHYCTLVGTELYTHSREDGERPGEGERACLWGWVCLAVWTDIWVPGLLSTMWLNKLHRDTAAFNNIDDPGCCSSFCQSYWCRCCVLGKVHRQWKMRESAAMGKVEGCLCGPMRSTPVTKPALVPYRFAAPPVLSSMDQQVTKSAAAIPETNQGPAW